MKHLRQILNEITLDSAIKKLKYGETGPYFLKLKVDNILLSKKSLKGSYRDIKQHRVSYSSGPIEVMYDRDKKVLILTDGWHRFTQLVIDGLKPTDYINVRLWSYAGINDYYIIPKGDNIFRLGIDKLPWE